MRIISMEPEKDIFDQWSEEISSKSWIARKLKSIKLWWNFTGKYLLIHITIGIKNIWYWLPVIWKDRHWDSHYIFDIMAHKLKAQSEYIGRRDFYSGAKRNAEIMMTCVRLMKLVKDEHYSSEYMDYNKTKHWFEPVPDKESLSLWKSKILEETFDDFFKKHPSAYKKVLANKKLQIFEIESKDGETDAKQRIAMNIGYYNHNRARKLLFKLIEENIEDWWD